jgi:hypothetical protein
MPVSISHTEPGAEALSCISLRIKSHSMSHCHLLSPLMPFTEERKLKNEEAKKELLSLSNYIKGAFTYRNFCRIFHELIRCKNKVTSLSMP